MTFKMKRNPTVYILASKKHGTLYIGVTSDILNRVSEHKSGERRGFTQTYQIHRLVYFEQYDTMLEAIAREKQLKKWRRNWKIDLIEQRPPNRDDLWEQMI